MLDPNQVIDVFKTKTLPGGTIPTATPSDVSPIPTVLPDVPTFEGLHHAGATTLCKNPIPAIWLETSANKF